MEGYIHSTESFGSVDGPGVRFIVFVSGCPMRCQFCHNPDTWAITNGTKIDSITLVKKALRCKPYWKNGGGVTVSGGEPLMQINFLIDFFKQLKAEGVHTTIDTSGALFTREGVFFEQFEELMQYTNLLLVDIKHINPQKHKELTGRDNANILDMLHYLSEIKKPIWIRHVLIPQINDYNEYLIQTRKFLDTLDNIEKIEVLPYHTLGVPKWEELGLKYELEGIDPPTEERIINANKILRTGKYE